MGEMAEYYLEQDYYNIDWEESSGVPIKRQELTWRTKDESMIPLEFAQAKAPPRRLPPMVVWISGILSHSAVFSALSVGTIFGIRANLSVASE